MHVSLKKTAASLCAVFALSLAGPAAAGTGTETGVPTYSSIQECIDGKYFSETFCKKGPFVKAPQDKQTPPAGAAGRDAPKSSWPSFFFFLR